MNILVTGGSGFIGSELVKRLSSSHQVCVLDLVKCKIDGVETMVGSILDQQAVNSALVNVEVVFHLAGQIDEGFSRRNPQKDLEVNGLGTLNLMEGCKENGVRRIIFASTAAVYGIPKEEPVSEFHQIRPITPYGCSKLCAEMYIKAYGALYSLGYTILRFFNIYGLKGKGVVTTFYNKAIENNDLEVSGDGSQYRDFLYIDDVIEAYLASLSDKARNKIFNIGSGQMTTIIDLTDKVIKVTNSKSKVRFVPMTDVSLRYPIANNEYAKRLLKFKPRYSIEDGLKSMHSLAGD